MNIACAFEGWMCTCMHTLVRSLIPVKLICHAPSNILILQQPCFRILVSQGRASSLSQQCPWKTRNNGNEAVFERDPQDEVGYEERQKNIMIFYMMIRLKNIGEIWSRLCNSLGMKELVMFKLEKMGLNWDSVTAIFRYLKSCSMTGGEHLFFLVQDREKNGNLNIRKTILTKRNV